jgi:hypothetical protein
MTMIAYYPDTTADSKGVPDPADSAAAYRASGVYRQVWGGHVAPSQVAVRRRSDDAATDTWVFASDAESDETPPRAVRLAPRSHTYTRVSTDRHAPYVRYRGRRAPTRTVDAALSEVPDAVLDLLADTANVTVVESL